MQVMATSGGEIKSLISMGENILVLREGENRIGVYNMQCGTLIRHIDTTEWIRTGLSRRKSCESDSNLVACTAIGGSVYVLISFCGERHRTYSKNSMTSQLCKTNVCKTHFSVLCTREEDNSNTQNVVTTSDFSVIGMSVTHSNNLLLILPDKLLEYTTYGSLVREIYLPFSASSLNNIVQMSSGNFIASHHGTHHRICIIKDGTLVRCYGDKPGADNCQLNQPRAMQIDVNGNILLADSGNNRVLVLNPFSIRRCYFEVISWRLWRWATRSSFSPP